MKTSKMPIGKKHMTALRRRTLVRTALMTPVAFGIIRSRAEAADFVFKFGNNVPDSYPLNVRTKQAADRIREATGGR